MIKLLVVVCAGDAYIVVVRVDVLKHVVVAGTTVDVVLHGVVVELTFTVALA